MKRSILKAIIKEEIRKMISEDVASNDPVTKAKQYTGSDLARVSTLVKKFAAKLQWVGIGAPLTTPGVYFPKYVDEDGNSLGPCVGILSRNKDKFYIGEVSKLNNLVKSSGITTVDPKEMCDQLVSNSVIGYSIPGSK